MLKSKFGIQPAVILDIYEVKIFVISGSFSLIVKIVLHRTGGGADNGH